MKLVVAIIRPDRLNAVLEELYRAEVQGLTISRVQGHGGDVELVRITTAGDVDRARGDKSRWTGALEAALLAGDIDLAVHSAKDVPGELADGTEIVALTSSELVVWPVAAFDDRARRRASACPWDCSATATR